MDEKQVKKLRAAGFTDDQLGTVVDSAERAARPLPVIRGDLSGTGKISWLVRYPKGYEEREDTEVVDLPEVNPEIMICGIDNLQQISEEGGTGWIYFEVNNKVVIDKRTREQRAMQNRGMPSKGCTIIFTDENGNLTVGMFYVSVTNLKALDLFAKKVKAAVNNFGGTRFKITSRSNKTTKGTWILYDYEMTDPPDDKWLDAFIKGMEEFKERERIYASDRVEQPEQESPGMGDEI